MSNFGSNNYKTELEVKVSLLEKENFELRGQLIDKLLIIKQLKTNLKSYPFTTDASTTTNTITTPAQIYDNINSNNDNNNNNNNNNSNNNINNNNCKTRTMTPPTTKITRSEILKKTIIALMKKAVYNEKLEAKLQEIQKEKHTKFLNLKTSRPN